jgi:hypothetical protein
MNCLRSLGRCYRGFESRLGHGCLVCVFILFCVVVCVGSDLATGWFPVQGVLPTVQRSRNWSETSVSRKQIFKQLMLNNPTNNRDTLSHEANFQHRKRTVYGRLEAVYDSIVRRDSIRYMDENSHRDHRAFGENLPLDCQQRRTPEPKRNKGDNYKTSTTAIPTHHKKWLWQTQRS